jgi:hypothetical protein
MATEKRTPISEQEGKLEKGIMLAKVVGYIDPSFMSGLEVTLLRENGNNIGELSQTYPVKYATPFYGTTAYEYMGLNNNDFQDTQKSYGMWFPTVEIGTTVLVVFIDGNPSDGYFIGCVPGRFANQMIPAIGGSADFDATDEQKEKYDTKQPLPVGEVNRKANSLEKSLSIDKIKRPVHPIADAFLQQGLLEDDVRGVTTSTSRRDSPNSVFGISTPGPFDRSSTGKKNFVGKPQSKSPQPVPVSRLGGTQMVFDDGEDRYQRKVPASEGGVEYADTENGEKGDPNIPYNEHFRIRTRTGHQILLHNSEDLIYIGNARGTTWIELTSNGKIDIYAEDSISIHSKNDFNFYADRDINIEAGRNINLKASAEFSKADPADPVGKIVDADGNASGRIQIESAFDFNLLVGANGKIQTMKYKDAGDADQDGNLEISIEGHTKIETGTGANAPHNLEILTTGSNNLTAGVSTNILSAVGHFETAGVIHMNGPAATPALPPTDAEEQDPPAIIKSLVTHPNIVLDSEEEWKGNNRYFFPTPLLSIMKRIPMHEPWPLHENNASSVLKPKDTDREIE